MHLLPGVATLPGKALPDMTSRGDMPAAGKRWLRWAATGLIGLLSLGLNYYHTRGVSLYFDEAYSVALARQDYATLWRYVWGPEQNMALYYILLHSWLALLRLLAITPSELMVRLPTIICMALAAVMTLQIGWRFWSPLAGVVAAILFALNPLVLQYAQQARAYGLQEVLVCLSWYALLAALRAPSEKRWWIVFATTSGLAVYAQLTSVFIIASQALIIGAALISPHTARDGLRRAWRSVAASLAGLAALITPMGVDVLLHGGDNGWVPPATPADALTFLTVTMSRSSAMFAVSLVVSGVAALSLSRKLATAGLAAWLLVPFALAYALTQPYFNAHVFWARYLIAIVPALCLLAGIGILALGAACASVITRLPALTHARITSERLQWVAPAFALCLLALAARIPPRYYATAQVQNFRQPLGWLEARYHVGDGFVCYPEGPLCAAPLDYYLQVDNAGDQRYPPEYAGDWPVAGGPMIHASGAALTAYLQRHTRVFVVCAMLGDVSHQLLGKRALLQFLASVHYHQLGQYATPSVQVYLYARGG